MKENKDTKESDIKQDFQQQLTSALSNMGQVFMPNQVISDYMTKIRGNVTDLVHIITKPTNKEEKSIMNTSMLKTIMEILADSFNIDIKLSADRETLILESFYLISYILIALQSNLVVAEEQMQTEEQ